MSKANCAGLGSMDCKIVSTAWLPWLPMEAMMMPAAGVKPKVISPVVVKCPDGSPAAGAAGNPKVNPSVVVGFAVVDGARASMVGAGPE